MNSKHIYQVVKKLNGPITPVGETNTDNERMDNLIMLTGLVDQLLWDISTASAYHISDEHSAKEIGLFAKKYIADLKASDL